MVFYLFRILSFLRRTRDKNNFAAFNARMFPLGNDFEVWTDLRIATIASISLALLSKQCLWKYLSLMTFPVRNIVKNGKASNGSKSPPNPLKGEHNSLDFNSKLPLLGDGRGSLIWDRQFAISEEHRQLLEPGTKRTKKSSTNAHELALIWIKPFASFA